MLQHGGIEAKRLNVCALRTFRPDIRTCGVWRARAFYNTPLPLTTEVSKLPPANYVVLATTTVGAAVELATQTGIYIFLKGLLR